MVIDRSDHIRADLGRLHGQSTGREVRISMRDVIGSLAAGMSVDEVIEKAPGLPRDDGLACHARAAERAALA